MAQEHNQYVVLDRVYRNPRGAKLRFSPTRYADLVPADVLFLTFTEIHAPHILAPIAVDVVRLVAQSSGSAAANVAVSHVHTQLSRTESMLLRLKQGGALGSVQFIEVSPSKKAIKCVIDGTNPRLLIVASGMRRMVSLKSILSDMGPLLGKRTLAVVALEADSSEVRLLPR